MSLILNKLSCLLLKHKFMKLNICSKNRVLICHDIDKIKSKIKMLFQDINM